MRHARVLFFLLLLAVVNLHAQTPHNNWIDYSKTYYKFKVGPFYYYGAGSIIKDGPVRISQSALAAAGLAAVPAEQLQLWHNGQEVQIYTSAPTGLLGANDYIEFWGEIPDGTLDAELYASQSYQVSKYWSLASDSSAYFFTTNAASTNKRIVQAANNVASATIQPDKNFRYTIESHFRDLFNGGRGSTVSETTGNYTFYSSQYASGEGFASRYFGPDNPQLPVGYGFGLHADTSAGGKITARVSVAGAALNPRNIQLVVNDSTISQFPVNYYNTAKITVNNISIGLAKSDGLSGFLQNLSSSPGDAACAFDWAFDYPRTFDFLGVPVFEFYLAASDTGHLIKVTDFQSNGVPPVLYDLTNGMRYIAQVSGDTMSFLLQPSVAQYRLAMVAGDGSVSTNITAFETRKFTDYSARVNQANYLIIASPLLNGSGSSNYVQQYRDYRASPTGGGYISKVYDINELEDQFAWGVKRHPLAIKSFLQYARSTFYQAPAYVFLIGKGIEYTQYRQNENDDLVYQTALVPTFGSPGSDNLLSSPNYDPLPGTPIGRLSAVSADEVGIYLAKIKQFEAAQQNTTSTPATKGWMKNVLHLTGGNDPVNGARWDKFMDGYKGIITDTLFGANVTSFSKSGSPTTYAQQLSNFDNIFNQGSSLISYFGHSSSTNLDFSLANPKTFTNTGKYPMFVINGCLAGNIFDYDAGRLSTLSTISEKFVMAPNAGSIGFESTTSYGLDSYLDTYTKEIYRSIGIRQYGKSFGQIMQDALTTAFNIYGSSDFYGRIHAEQYTFQGDPALKLNSFSKPDYAVVAADFSVSPAFVSVADDSFSVKILVHNLGKATADSVHFVLYKQKTNGDKVIVFTKEFKTLKVEDSIEVKVPIVGNSDIGGITLVANINDNSAVNETTYANNTAQVLVPVSAAEIRPIFPFNYAVVPTDVVTLSAATANPLDTAKHYVMEFDTTALFNSGAKQSFTRTSSGGLLEFKNIALPLNNTVYYWRIAIADTNQHWNMFSFIHRSGANAGFQQSHYFQHLGSSLNGIAITPTRQFAFGTSASNLFVKQGIYPFSGKEDNDFSIAINGTFVSESACVGNSVIFTVFNPVSLAPKPNPGSLYGSGASCKVGETENNFEFSITSPASRDNARQFLDNFVKDGDYVVARSTDYGTYAPEWATDSTIYGAGNTLYSRFKAQGIQIDSFAYGRSYIFMFKKNESANFSPVSVFSQGYYDAISLSENLPVTDTLGYVTSPKFGPAKQWNNVSWQGADVNANNVTSLNIYGIDKNNNRSLLYTIGKSQAQQDISAISASDYPYIQLQMRTQDSVTSIPYQLNNWLVQYTPVPEGSLAANIGVSLPDTIKVIHPINTQPDTLQGYVVFKNVSVTDFDALKVKFVLYDTAGKVVDTLPAMRTKPLVAGDTVSVGFIADVTAVPQGKYNMYLFVNADNDQPEQYLFNNSLYKYVFIQREKTLPVHLIDFTGSQDGKGVLLNWKVANELNFSHYGIERSTNGRSFGTIGTVAATNSNLAIKNYSFFDNNPAEGKNFYRLKLVDKDGLFSYSNIVSVNFGAAFEISVYPNPFAGKLNIMVKGGSNTGNMVAVYDLSGKKLLQQTFNGASTTLEVTNLSTGTYVVQVNNGNILQTFKLQKHAN